jgi:hypothetical protein
MKEQNMARSMIKQMEENMQAVLSDKGVYAAVKITKDRYRVTLYVMKLATVILEYKDDLTPAEVIVSVCDVHERLTK